MELFQLKYFVNIANMLTHLAERGYSYQGINSQLQSNVNTYNIRIQQLPDVFIARMMNLQHKDLFKVAEEDRRDVEVKLGQ